MQDSDNLDFHLLLALAAGFEKIEEQSGYKIVLNAQDSSIYLFEPNATNPFDKISIDTYTKELHNDTSRARQNTQQTQHRDKTGMEGYASQIIGRVRGILEERSRQGRGESEECKETSRRSGGISRQDRGLSQTSNAFSFLFRKQILTQESLEADRQAVIDLHKEYKDYKKEAIKARAIKAYLELGGIASDDVSQKYATKDNSIQQNITKDNLTQDNLIQDNKDTSQDLQNLQDSQDKSNLQNHQSISNEQKPKNTQETSTTLQSNKNTQKESTSNTQTPQTHKPKSRRR